MDFRPLRSDGFTLLELLVAIAAASLFLGLLSESLGSLTKAYAQLAHDRPRQQADAMSVRLLRDLLRSATPPYPADDSLRFVGRPHEVIFAASPSEGITGDGTLRVRIYQENDSSGNRALFADAVRSGIGTEVRTILDRHLLFSNLRSAKFRYYEDTPQGLRETDRWSETGSLPSLIRIDISGSEDTRGLTVEAAPRRSDNSRCRFDQIGLTCR